jgi:uncharacterized damage-inducible protein DinB
MLQPTQAQTTQVDDLMADIVEVEEKVVGLANAMSLEQYGWRPGEGVRSVSEVFQHVAADNFLLAAPFMEIPAWTEMDATDYSTVQAFENREIDRAQVIDEMKQSFAHLKSALETLTDAKLAEPVTLFGQTWSAHRLWILTVGHMHEHLGQSIAYARMNGVVPPWSR